MTAGDDLPFKCPVDFQAVVKLEASPEFDIVAEDCIHFRIVHEMGIVNGLRRVNIFSQNPLILLENLIEDCISMYDPGFKFDESALRNLWKVNPSRLEGYVRNYSTVTPEGDEMEIDFNYVRQMVKITIRPEREPGREFYAVIKSGTILQERELASRRPIDLTSRLVNMKGYFRFLNDENVLKAIGGNYDLPTEPEWGSSRMRDSFKLVDTRPKNLYEKIRRYLEEKHRRENDNSPFWKKFLRRVPAETMDMGLGVFLILAYLFHWISLTELAGFSGAMGIFLGAIDWVWRRRSPFLPKVVLMLATSMMAVYIQIQYRVWGIFL